MTSQMLLLKRCDVIENNSIANNAAIPLVEKCKLLMNTNEWIAHVQEKQFSFICDGHHAGSVFPKYRFVGD